MLRTAKVWCLAGATLLLGLLAGVCDPDGPPEKAIRSQRVRVSRVARPDIDHDALDHSADALQGKAVTSLASQSVPNYSSPSTDAAPLPESFFRLLIAEVGSPITELRDCKPGGILPGILSGRSPPKA